METARGLSPGLLLPPPLGKIACLGWVFLTEQGSDITQDQFLTGWGLDFLCSLQSYVGLELYLLRCSSLAPVLLFYLDYRSVHAALGVTFLYRCVVSCCCGLPGLFSCGVLGNKSPIEIFVDPLVAISGLRTLCLRSCVDFLYYLYACICYSSQLGLMARNQFASSWGEQAAGQLVWLFWSVETVSIYVDWRLPSLFLYSWWSWCPDCDACLPCTWQYWPWQAPMSWLFWLSTPMSSCMMSPSLSSSLRSLSTIISYCAFSRASLTATHSSSSPCRCPSKDYSPSRLDIRLCRCWCWCERWKLGELGTCILNRAVNIILEWVNTRVGIIIYMPVPVFVICGAVAVVFLIYRACQRRQRHQMLIQQYNQQAMTRNQQYNPPPQLYAPLGYNLPQPQYAPPAPNHPYLSPAPQSSSQLGANPQTGQEAMVVNRVPLNPYGQS